MPGTGNPELQRLRQRPSSEAGPSQPVMQEVPQIQRNLLLGQQLMAHELVDEVAPTIGNHELVKLHLRAIRVLTAIAEGVGGDRQVGGNDDIANSIKRITKGIDTYYQKTRPDLERPQNNTEVALKENPKILETKNLLTMQKLLSDIDYAILAKKQGTDKDFMKPKSVIRLNPTVAADASTMVAGLETGFNPPSDGDAIRIQRLLKDLSEGIAPSGVDAEITDIRKDAVKLVQKLRQLVTLYPELGQKPSNLRTD